MGIAASGLRMGMQIVVWDQIWLGKNEFPRVRPYTHAMKLIDA